MSTDARLESLFKDLITQGDPITDPAADRETYEHWDSLANMTLMMAVIDEFGDVISLDDMDQFTSFANISKLVSERT